jgi:2-polyprenyl-3-methyl-5-hydroxy-6-metoxy-1,4-benzoquinol methylase
LFEDLKGADMDINPDGTVYVGIPRERIYMTQFVDNRDAILTRLTFLNRGAGYFQADGHRVDRNRDRIVEAFLAEKNKPEWLLMIDSDMEHPTDIAERLTKWGKPIVGGLYFHRGYHHDPFVFDEAPEGKDNYDRTTRFWRPLRDEVYDFLETNNVPMRDGAFVIDKPIGEPLLECGAVATGSIMIHRSVFEAMKPPWFEYESGGNSEDLTFCYKVKHDLDLPVYVDLSTASGHYVLVPLGQAQFRMKHKARGFDLTSYTKRNSIAWLKKAWKITEAEATKKIETSNGHVVGDLYRVWAKRLGHEPSDEEIMAFYSSKKTGKTYILELLHWNFSPVFHQLRQMLFEIRKSNVIEIGAGIGTVALQLAIQHNNVLAVEPNRDLRNFIDIRYQETLENIATDMGQLSIVGLEWLEKTEPNSFKYAVSFDTFEHLTACDLEKTLERLFYVLEPGGRVVFHANWYQQDLYPMHFDHSELFDFELLPKIGFLRLSPTELLKPVKI